MSNKHIALFVGGAALILIAIRHFTSLDDAAAGGTGSPGSADASIGANPLGAAQGTTDANGDPYGGLGG